MIFLNRIFTRTGDKGETSLGDKSRVSKNNCRINAIGSVDELNSFVGLCILNSPNTDRLTPLKNRLIEIQQDLFDLGADLCIPVSDKDIENKPLRISESQVKQIEKDIEDMKKNLGSLSSFILPGGSTMSTYLHVCRTVCRRAERQIVELSEIEYIGDNIIRYINRLSDFFFVAARFVNKECEGPESTWLPRRNQK